MRRLIFGCVVTGLVLGGAGCASRPAPSLASRLEQRAGCYLLEPGPWQSDEQLARFHPPERVPRFLQLDAARLPGWTGLQNDTTPLLTVHAFGESGVRSTEFTYWTRASGTRDEIVIGRPLPLGGARLMLRPEGNDLAGEIMTFTDFIPPDGIAHASAPVRARRVRCPLTFAPI